MGPLLSLSARVAARRAVRLGLADSQVKLEEQQMPKLSSNGNLHRGLHTPSAAASRA